MSSSAGRPGLRAVIGCLLMIAIAGEASGSGEPWIYTPPPCVETDAISATWNELLRCHTPVFVVEDGAEEFNRIGAPTVRMRGSREHVEVDPARHTVFATTLEDRIGERDVVHLVYRIHFTKIPFRFRHFWLTHDNVGVLSLVTLDSITRQPLFLTTVFTCGCYRALLPTTLIDEAVLPEHYPEEEMEVWGEVVPAVLEPPRPGRDRLVVTMRSTTHRVSDMEVTERMPEGKRAAIELRPMEELHELPIEGRPGEVSSFFYTSGPLRGYVRGAWAAYEGLTLGLLIFDPMIGSDKDFGDPAETGVRFYTMLSPFPSVKEVSRLDRFDPLLGKLGFHTEAIEIDERAFTVESHGELATYARIVMTTNLRP